MVQSTPLWPKVGFLLLELAWWLTAANIKQSTKLASGYQETLVVIKQENQNSFLMLFTLCRLQCFLKEPWCSLSVVNEFF